MSLNLKKTKTRRAEDAMPPRLGSDRPSLSIVWQPINALMPSANNTRLHNRDQIAKLARSISAFGFNSPILVNGAGTIIAGHARLLAACELGFKEVPTISIVHLSDEQARAFVIADNRIAELATWDDKGLALELQELSTLSLDFELELTGFDTAEIDLRIQSLEHDTAQNDGADDLPDEGPSISRNGDLWALGDHRVLCGDALKAASYDAVLGENKADLVFTDAPYNVPIDGHATGLGKKRHREFAMASGEMTDEEFGDFLYQTCKQLAARSKQGAMQFLCMDWRSIGRLLAAGEHSFGQVFNLCVWVKTNAGMGSFYRSQHELVAIFKNGKARHQNNVLLGKYGRNRTNVWNYAGANALSRRAGQENLLALHPTAKPVALVADAILDASKRRDMVLDPFLGSGSTLIAAEKTGRRCFGIELDPLYIDTVIRRWEKFTGRRARLVSTGLSFEATAEERNHA